MARRLGGRIIRRRGPLGTTTLLTEARPDFADLAALTAVGGIVPVSPAVPAPPRPADTGVGTAE